MKKHPPFQEIMRKPLITWPALYQVIGTTVLVALCLISVWFCQYVISGDFWKHLTAKELAPVESLPGKSESAAYQALGTPYGVYYRTPGKAGKGRVSTMAYPSPNYDSPPPLPFDKVLIYSSTSYIHYVYVNKKGRIFATFSGGT